MAKKEFTYKGFTVAQLQEMSLTQVQDIMSASARRKIKRGFTEQEKIFLQNLAKSGVVKTHCRDMIILPAMVNRSVKVANGKGFEEVKIAPEMLGHRLGEFALTRKRLRHGQAGIGSTKGSANKEKK